MKMMSSLVVLLGLVVAAYCGTHSGVPTLPGACPDFKAFENIDIAKVSGDWFEHYHAKDGDEDDHALDEKCEKKTITAKGDGFEDVLVYVDGSDGKEKTEKKLATKLPGNRAVYTITGDDVAPQGTTVTASILDTDYTNRLLKLTCFTDGKKHGYLIGAFGRGKTFSADDTAKVKEALKSQDINVELLPVAHDC